MITPPQITARCHPALYERLPKPVAAKQGLPNWLRDMPSEVASDTLGGESVRTVKQCPPFIDALSLGILIPLAADLTVKDGHISWDWNPPIITDAPLTRAPIGLHVPEQATGGPFTLGPGEIIVKFINFWALEAPQGWNLLFTHPFGHPNLPFQTLTGLVSADQFGLGYVHFPARWTDPSFTGCLEAGTPVAQVIAVPRAPQGVVVKPMSGDEIAQSKAIQDALMATPGVYRKDFRRG